MNSKSKGQMCLGKLMISFPSQKKKRKVKIITSYDILETPAVCYDGNMPNVSRATANAAMLAHQQKKNEEESMRSRIDAGLSYFLTT